MDEDYQLALLLQKEFNDEEPEVVHDSKRSGKENRPTANKNVNSLVDPQWEFIDPTPDIHVLFMQFNERFFWHKLHGVEVRWSPRMTSCAGVCVYQGRSGFCSVRLSLPLLKLRPRKDLVETLLHEMIHAFLFVTKNNRDRDGHGPEFHKHMNRINQEAGTRITVYHSFHDEVRLYQQHWWRCNGPCQKRPPYFGMVRRAMNRAPGPADVWWAQHEATCGGKYIKVKEPENTKKSTSDAKKKLSDESSAGKRDIRNFFPGAGSSKAPGGLLKPPNVPSSSSSSGAGPGRLNNTSNPSWLGAPASRTSPSGPHGTQPQPQQPGIFRKPTMSNVHGFGGDQSALAKPVVNPAVNNVFGFSDLHGNGTSKPSGSRQPSGKGYVLGGTGKPPGQRRGGAYGGMLANKGSGTLVVSGTSNKARDPPALPSNSGSSLGPSQTASINVFSGSGHVLGKGVASRTTPANNPAKSNPQGSHTKKANPFQKNSPVLTNRLDGSQVPGETLKRSPPYSFSDVQPKKKSLDGFPSSHGESSTPTLQPKVPCPVCNRQVLESVINSHLDDCISTTSKPVCKPDVQTKESSSNVIVLSDSSDEEDAFGKESVIDCPGCNEKMPQTQLDAHLRHCLNGSFDDGDDGDVVIAPEDNGKNAKCPICCETFPVADMDKHLDNCASCSVQDLSGVFDENFSDDEEEDAAVGSPSKNISESGERLYPCPCCLILIETGKMNEHLDQCML